MKASCKTMKSRRKRFFFVILGLAGVGIASAMIINALRGNLNYYLTPSKVIAGEIGEGKRFRLGGMVREGSLKRDANSLEIEFILTDYQSNVTVRYEGILPDLFKEQQSAVTKGQLSNGVFIAEEVLAKHDPSYMPPEVQESLHLDKKRPEGSL